MTFAELRAAIKAAERKSPRASVLVHPASGNLVATTDDPMRVDVIATIPKLENRPVTSEGEH